MVHCYFLETIKLMPGYDEAIKIITERLEPESVPIGLEPLVE
jgi:hypothetical protein